MRLLEAQKHIAAAADPQERNTGARRGFLPAAGGDDGCLRAACADHGYHAGPDQMPTPPVMTPIPTPAPTPDPTPEPTPEPPREDPNTPHLFIENQTLPESMPRYGVADLYGEIYTDKGVIAMVTGRIFSNDSGEDVQICNFYPYTNTFSLAGTVNAQLIFGVLEPGSYTYIVSAIAENESYSSGSVVLIEHGFQIYYD